MTYIRISITINEVKIREEIYRLLDHIKESIKHNYHKTFIRANELGTSHGEKGIMARIHKILDHTQEDYTGTILCDNQCRSRNCQGHTISINSYIRKLRAAQ